MLHILRPGHSEQYNTEEEYYGIGAKKLDTDTPYSLAKHVIVVTKDKTSDLYYCKFNTSGIEAGHLLNPWSMYADATNNGVNPGFNKMSGKPIQEYRLVTKDIFDLYLNYLRTRSHVYFHQAERLALENL